ncbi:uncharacterized protein LOC104907801 isoform X2 [Beta vulgaris subsp. vulgaris]|nr:uncharacterized protein LOC104907801 isoform X2 [Beta vulgaris subsp. vulgaris]XP_010695095.1 uncharacterized protein LOC104907801 isoform X2 [Beta vulgaris subsp. vulgaris]XP_019108228.1 uncharacterized protein LOC104907801 isoform X2 [Beta vulgaris subsp. vulgaris]
MKNVGVIFLITIVATIIYQFNLPPPPRLCGLPGGPPITAPRVKLRDGRYLAYKEIGVPKENAKFKVIFVHGFGNSRHDVVVAANLPRRFIEQLGLYIVSFDRPGYGESDPDPKRTVKSMALDIEELADQLKLGDTFYLIGFSMGGQTVWGSLKYIPHRLAGAALLAPVVNYWWSGFPADLAKEAFQKQAPQDQWAQTVVYYFPRLTYWWNTQKLFPGSSVAAGKAELSPQDLELIPKIISLGTDHRGQVKQQGEFESLHRDMMIGFGSWEFSPINLTDPIPSRQGSVHLWQGNEDTLVPVTLQRYIAQKLPWIKYHEVAGAGHLFPFATGMAEAILRALLLGVDP